MLKKRIEYLDIAKAIGVAFVLLGHTGIPEVLRAAIYSFHMPLFFAVSGIWFKSQSHSATLKKSAARCLRPYIIFSLVFASLNLIVFHDRELAEKNIYDIFLGRGTCNVLWFLFSLFIVENIYQIVVHYAKKPLTVTFLLMAAALAFKIVGIKNYWFILSSLEALFFYSLGHTVLRPENIKKIFSIKYFIVFLITDVLMFGICYKIYPNRLDLSDASLGFFPVSLVMAVVGILLIFMVSEWISKHTKYLKVPLLYIGEHSLYFFTLTAFLPGLMEGILTSIGMENISAIIKLVLKLSSFVIVYIVLRLKTMVINYMYNKKKKGLPLD